MMRRAQPENPDEFGTAGFGEHHRPQLHFSPERNWLNDPVGLVHFDGRFHLFHQYNPSGNDWGNMHWGHAVSSDLIHWEHRPVALHAEPAGLGYVFSGSAVVDWNNSSGLKRGELPPLVAIFTHCSAKNRQVQSLAFSTDGGDNWQMHDGNPVLDNPGIADFRDPKIIRDHRRDQWIMALAAHDRISFYRSGDLLSWTHCSDFGAGLGAHGGVWECPDLIPLPDPETGEERWVLIVSLNPGGPSGGSGTQYFIGDFDGRQFRTGQSEPLWLDHGADNYAGVTWSDAPDGRRILIGWMSNWRYAGLLPTSPWRGAMTLPRELRLVRTPAGPRLAAPPVEALSSLRTGTPIEFADVRITTTFSLDRGRPLPELLDLEFHVAGEELALRFFNQNGEELVLRFDSRRGRMTIDRSRASAGVDLDAFFPKIEAPLNGLPGESLGIRLVKDASSLEVWLADGRALATLVHFTENPLDRLELQALDADRPVHLQTATIHRLSSIWGNGRTRLASRCRATTA